jgi:hypothetical protein
MRRKSEGQTGLVRFTTYVVGDGEGLFHELENAKREYVRAIIHLGVPMLAQATYSSPCPWLRQFHKCALERQSNAPHKVLKPWF